MTRILFVGAHAAAAAAFVPGAGYDGPEPPDAILDALDEAGVGVPPRATGGDVVVDTDAWNLPEPVGLCLEEARELRTEIERRVAELR
jgi:hypothetical protein